MRHVIRGVALCFGAFVVVGCSNDDMLARSYLRQAQDAIAQRRAAQAIADLDKAEDVWLGRNYGHTENYVVAIEPELLRQIARARQSVQMQLWGDASYYVAVGLMHPSLLTPGL